MSETGILRDVINTNSPDHRELSVVRLPVRHRSAGLRLHRLALYPGERVPCSGLDVHIVVICCAYLNRMAHFRPLVGSVLITLGSLSPGQIREVGAEVSSTVYKRASTRVRCSPDRASTREFADALEDGALSA